MKLSLILTLICGLVVAGVACKIVDPFLVALNLPLEVSALISGGNSWNETKSYTIQDEINKVSTSYVDKVKATRVSGITISMPNPPSSGTASGTIAYALDGGSLTTLATFSNVPFDSLKTPGISLLHTSLISYNVPALAALLNKLQDSTGLPATATVAVQTSGTTSVTVPLGTKIVATIHYQVDVSI
jgi:hypothetical protein